MRNFPQKNVAFEWSRRRLVLVRVSCFFFATRQQAVKCVAGYRAVIEFLDTTG